MRKWVFFLSTIFSKKVIFPPKNREKLFSGGITIFEGKGAFDDKNEYNLQRFADV